MYNVIISPYSRKLRNGKNNPKNYPYWAELVSELTKQYHIIQIGVKGEDVIEGVDETKLNLRLKEITSLINNCHFWISVDNFLQHLASHTDKRGIVIWGMSNPQIFGYSQNINILKDKKYLRPEQFNIWEAVEYNKDVFVEPKVVLDYIHKYI